MTLNTNFFYAWNHWMWPSSTAANKVITPLQNHYNRRNYSLYLFLGLWKKLLQLNIILSSSFIVVNDPWILAELVCSGKPKVITTDFNPQVFLSSELSSSYLSTTGIVWHQSPHRWADWKVKCLCFVPEGKQMSAVRWKSEKRLHNTLEHHQGTGEENQQQFTLSFSHGNAPVQTVF